MNVAWKDQYCTRFILYLIFPCNNVHSISYHMERNILGLFLSLEKHVSCVISYSGLILYFLTIFCCIFSCTRCQITNVFHFDILYAGGKTCLFCLNLEILYNPIPSQAVTILSVQPAVLMYIRDFDRPLCLKLFAYR